jgi:hypothetical protein
MRRPRFIGHHLDGDDRSGSSVIKGVKVAADASAVTDTKCTMWAIDSTSVTEYRTNLCAFFERLKKNALWRSYVSPHGSAPKLQHGFSLNFKMGVGSTQKGRGEST